MEICKAKIMINIIAGKLLSRTHKIAFNLLNKVGAKGEAGVKPGDRVCMS